jgi:hypothetical protein
MANRCQSLWDSNPETHCDSVVQQASALADHMEALAIELRSMSDDSKSVIPTNGTLSFLAKRTYDARRAIDKIFGLSGFAVSPAWDMMLDLFQARSRQEKVSVSSACIGAACPPTTALRWLVLLEDMQLIVRVPDENDRRRVIVELTECAVVKISKALESYL